MADHRSFGSRPHPVLHREAPEHFPERRGVPAPPSKLRGRLLVAALTAGACVAAALSGDQAEPGSSEPPAAHRIDRGAIGGGQIGADPIGGSTDGSGAVVPMAALGQLPRT